MLFCMLFPLFIPAYLLFSPVEIKSGSDQDIDRSKLEANVIGLVKRTKHVICA